MSRPIRGVSKSSLWEAWKEVRKELKKVQPRDVVDHLEYDVDPDVWIKRLLTRIETGRYEPETPERSKAGKSLGFSRTITNLSIPDAVLYRVIAECIYGKAKRRQRRHVYFHRGDATVAEKQRLKALEVDEEPSEGARSVSLTKFVDYADEGGYGSGRPVSLSWFLNWKLMALYRRDLIEPEEPERWFVLTDITNFFDSVLHDHVAEALRELAIPFRMVGLLLFLLERLAVRDEYAHSPAIGLPVEQLDGSRTIAHVVLFAHDDEFAPLVGEDRYLRWMDDQLFVVKSREEALRLLGQVQASLARLHLTPNAKKTKILTRDQAFRHYHVDVNQALDECYKMAYGTDLRRRSLSVQLSSVWRSAEGFINNGDGEAGKILSRFYLLAARAKRRFLRERCLGDILKDPTMAERVAAYARHVESPTEFWKFAQEVIAHPEQVYADVNLTMVEHLLRLEPDAEVAKEIRTFAGELLEKPQTFVGGNLCAAVAPLLLLRFADGRSLKRLKSCLGERRVDSLPVPVLRACGIVYASQGRKQLADVESVAAQRLRNRLSEMVRLLRRLMEYKDVPDRFKSRLDARRESLTETWYVDMRTLLTARLLSLNERPAVRQWLRDWKTRMLEKGVSDYDKALIDRLIL